LSRAKRVPGILLAVVFIAGLGFASGPVSVSETLANVVGLGPGDVDGNGVINAADVTMLRRYIAAADKNTFMNQNSGFVEANAHTAGAATITANDVTRLRQYLAAADPSSVQLQGKPPEGRRDLRRSDFPAGTRFIALTFDDGPNTTYTVQILEELKRHGASATFYVNGNKINAQTTPILQRMVREGHDVDNHSWQHASFGQPIDSMPNVTTQSAAIADLRNTSQAIYNATGFWPWSFRPPFLELGSWMSGLDSNPAHLGRLPFIDTGIDTLDYNTQGEGGARTIADRVLNATRGNPWPAQSHPDGGIVLMHDCGGARRQTVASLALFIPQMKARNPRCEFVTVRQLFQITETNPETWTGVTMWPRVNQWVPVSARPWNSPVYLWDTPPPASYYTNPTPPWNR
jgi:peptidoglycan/xylan/chitin deacetylase (PgdA/CDA1 family)